MEDGRKEDFAANDQPPSPIFYLPSPARRRRAYIGLGERGGQVAALASGFTRRMRSSSSQ